MKKIYIFLFSCVTVLSAVAQTTPNLYRAVDKEKMNHWVDSVFDAMSYDERVVLWQRILLSSPIRNPTPAICNA